jgi:ribonucleoside-triphosphate reductase
MYENIRYAEMNGKFDYCQECGYEGEILLDENNEWYCPNCGNRNHETMNVARRTCGYIGDNFWNDGRTAEISDRYVHVDNKEIVFEED